MILVLGASGYVGGRLVPDLLRGGHDVRCMTRSPERLERVEWVQEHRRSGSATRLEICDGDLGEPESLEGVFDDVEQVVYLVHSLGSDDFEERERTSARHACEAAERAGVRHIVYLSGLGDEDDDLSPHLRSRHVVGRELASGSASVTELRAAVVLGAGSASFEMMRSLVDVLPVMIAPRWVTSTRLQPIAIVDVLNALCSALEHPEGFGPHRVIGIGGPDVVTYEELMQIYADVVGIRRRVIAVPVLSLGLSAHWVNLVTPLPRQLAATLIDSLEHDVVVTDSDAEVLAAPEPLPIRRAIEMALSAIQDLDIPTRWSGVTERERSARPRPWDPEWAGGTVYVDHRELTIESTASEFHRTVRGIGGDRGWYGFGPLWRVRGLLDKVVGGAGLRRGRRHPDKVSVGEAIDFWRVDALDEETFRLRAEMLLPGEAWLEWTTESDSDGATRVVQRASYVPHGLFGRLYWWVLMPFHAVIFPIMLRRIAGAAAKAADPAPDAT